MGRKSSNQPSARAYRRNSAENRAAFVRDDDAYCRKFGLTDEQRAAVRSRSVLAMIEAGGNVYYLAKLAGIFGLNVQDIGAQQTGTSVDAFKAKLAAAGAADVASDVRDRATARACESRHPHTGG